MHERAIWQLYKVHNNMRNRDTSDLKQPQTSSELTTFSPLVSLRLSTWELSTKTERASEVNLQFWLEGKLVLKLKEMRKCQVCFYSSRSFLCPYREKSPWWQYQTIVTKTPRKRNFLSKKTGPIPLLSFPLFFVHHSPTTGSWERVTAAKVEWRSETFSLEEQEQPEGKRK